MIPSPARGANLDFLEGVSAVSAKDVRAVGYRHHPSTPLVMQWNGSVWSVVSAHFPGDHAGLAGVDQVPGTNTVWGVGNQVAAPLMYGQPLIERSC